MLDTSLDSFHFYFVVAALQGFILSAIIIFQGPGKKPHLLLGIFLLLYSLSVLHGVLEESIHAFNAKFPFPLSYSFVYGPLAYFHIKAAVHPHLRSNIHPIVHFIPSLLIDFLFFVLFFSYVHFNMEWAYDNVENIQLLFLWIGLGVFLHMSAYTFFIRKLIRKVRGSEMARSITGWLRIFSIFWVMNLGFIGIVIPVAILNIERFDDHLYLAYQFAGVLGGICIYWLGYQYLLKYRARINKYLHRLNTRKYSSGEIASLKSRLVEALQTGELYKDEKLNVEALARHLGWPARDVSWVIGEGFATNFNDLINRYRIEAFKALVVLPENKKYTMAGLAQMVGFNSKTSFYRAFKKTCGQTPKEYLDGLPLK